MKFTGRIREPEKLTASFPALKLPLSGGYEEGYADGRTDGYTAGEQAARAEAVAHNAAILTDCNAVLPDKGVELADTLDQVPQRIEEIKAEPMWLPYLQNLRMACNGVTFPPNTELVFDVPNLDTDMTYLVREAKNVKKVTLICDNWRYATSTKASVSMHQAFTYIEALKTIDMTRFNVVLGDCMLMAAGTAVREILGNLNLSRASKISDAFNTPTLETIRIVPGTAKLQINFSTCSKLTDASIQSIIDGLADLTGATAQTITFHWVVYDILTEEQQATIAAKNWTLVRA